ncbi:tetratricopeptide repeat-containing sensor histidine kinase [Hymenobacter ruricola]|uniref:histidine kinase n=1 Tax=Hymenobacter ruricola TaxID=2791023 RepID=A0ABS0I811_9BACT|nr:ATP-binding protein [Hymenobacter ruricola]MBF9223103.1 hypothetical protein [Hymenobacter ruricola]
MLPVLVGLFRNGKGCRAAVLVLAACLGRAVPARAATPPPAADSLRARLHRPGLPDTARVRAYWRLSRALESVQLDSARACARQGAALARRIGDAAGLAQCQHALAFVEYLAGNYPAAQQAYAATVRPARRAGLCSILGHAYMGLGLVADGMHNLPGAVAYFRQARAVYAQCQPPSPRYEMVLLTNWGNTYLQAGQLDKAGPPLRQALQLVRPATTAKSLLNLLDLIGLLQLAQHHPDSALVTFRHELQLARTKRERRAETYALGNLAAAHLALHQPAEALPLARQAVALARQTGNQSQLADYTLVLARALHALRRPEAFDTLLRFNALHDTLESQDRNAEIVRQQTRFDVAGQQARIRALEQQRRIEGLEAEQRTVRNRLLLGGGAGVGVMLVGLFVGAYRRRQREREAALRHQLAADLHDDVGSLLARIALQTDLLQEGLGAPGQQQSQLAEVADNSRMAVRQLNDVVWNLDAQNDSVPNLLDRLRDYAHEVLVPTGRDVRFVADDAIGASVDLSPLVRRHLYLIFKEALHNVLKYAPANATVTVTLHRAGSLLSLAVENTGAGAPASSPGPGRGSGHGLRNIQERTARLGGTAQTEALADGGFAVRVSVPV